MVATELQVLAVEFPRRLVEGFTTLMSQSEWAGGQDEMSGIA